VVLVRRDELSIFRRSRGENRFDLFPF